MRLLAALLLVLLVAPLGAAQVPFPGVVSTTSASVEDPGRALQPGKLEGLTVLVNYRWGAGATPAPDDPASETNQTRPTRITLAVKQVPSWVENASFDPAEVLAYVNPQVPGAGGNAALVANLIIGIRADAPALQREDIVVTATAEQNGNIPASSGESPPVKLRAAIVSKINVTSEPSMIVPGGRWTAMPFTIRNDGNTELKVKLNVTARPQDSQVEYPETVTLPRNASQVVEVRLRVPWTGAETGIVELEAVALLDDGEPRAARSSIDVLGQSAVPAAPGLLAALAALALARGRRRA